MASETGYSLTEQEGSVAMSRFLHAYVTRARGYDMADLWGAIWLDRDGMPSDPAQWEDWIECVQAVKSGEATPLATPSDS